ncbi:MAG TPA: hypothetical protein VGL82_07565 [Bryobacteraceae bacterium]
MNLPHVHLLLNHFPIIGTIIALGLFLFALIGNSDDLKRASLVIFTGIALLAIPTYMSGNGAQDALKKLPNISTAAVTAHNNAAVVSMAFVELTGLFAWIALWQFRRFRHARRWALVTVLLLSVATVYFMSVTGNTGGEIRHTEIVSVQQAQANAGAPIPLVDAAALGVFITGTKWMWPVCETLHFIGLSLLMGVVFLVDLRMMGMMKSLSFPVLHRLLPWGILGFGLNVLTGLLFFIGNPGQYFASTPFQWKMAFVLVAGANALYFTMFDEVWALAPGDDAPMRAKVAAGSAVALWIAIMWCGNMLPFIGDSF